MKGIYRNLRFWGRKYEYMMCWGSLVLVGMAVLSCLMVGNPKEIPVVLAEAGNTSVYITMFLILMGFNGADIYFPFSISMGSSRRDSFIGMVIMIHVIGLEFISLMVVLGCLSGGSLLKLAPTMVSCLFIGLFFGNLFSAVLLRFGRKAAFFAYSMTVLTIVLTVLIFNMVNATSEVTVLRKVLEIWKMLPLQAWIVIGVVGAILLDASSILLQWLSARKIEVRV